MESGQPYPFQVVPYGQIRQVPPRVATALDYLRWFLDAARVVEGTHEHPTVKGLDMSPQDRATRDAASRMLQGYFSGTLDLDAQMQITESKREPPQGGTSVFMVKGR